MDSPRRAAAEMAVALILLLLLKYEVQATKMEDLYANKAIMEVKTRTKSLMRNHDDGVADRSRTDVTMPALWSKLSGHLPSREIIKQTLASCPASCFRANPVCGVDDVTYWCGSVDAECAGVEVKYAGFCVFGSKGTGGRGKLAVQCLLLVHMIWLVFAAFLVLLGVP